MLWAESRHLLDFLWIVLVGAVRFELTTPCSQSGKLSFLANWISAAWGKVLRGKVLFSFKKTALNEKISICAAAAHNSACGSYRFILYAL
jgi:hypothetical protein